MHPGLRAYARACVAGDRNSIPDEYSLWGGFTKLHDEGLKKQIALIKGLKSKDSLNDEEQKISTIWEASSSLFRHADLTVLI